MGIFKDAGEKFVNSLKGLGTSNKETPTSFLHDFITQKSVLRSTHFIVNVKDGSYASNGVNTFDIKPWLIEDFGLSLPQIEYESVGYAQNTYTFPIIKSSDPVKLTLTMADDESGTIYNWLFTKRADVFSNGFYELPAIVKDINATINIYKPDGQSTITTLQFNNMFISNIEDIKYSYGSLTDYQKYSVTFICDPSQFTFTKN